jgi:hypothetical protein
MEPNTDFPGLFQLALLVLTAGTTLFDPGQDKLVVCSHPRHKDRFRPTLLLAAVVIVITIIAAAILYLVEIGLSYGDDEDDERGDLIAARH